MRLYSQVDCGMLMILAIIGYIINLIMEVLRDRTRVCGFMGMVLRLACILLQAVTLPQCYMKYFVMVYGSLTLGV